MAHYSKSTRYGLYAAMDLARATEPITVSDVARRYSIPEGALAKVMQNLVRAGIARGLRGVGGGYSLAKPASDVTVQDVIAVFEPPRPRGTCLLDAGGDGCEAAPECRLRTLFDEVEELSRNTFASVSLVTLVGGRGPGPQG